MSDIKWKASYEVGHERIDFEHRIFVDLIAKIDDATTLGKDMDYIQRLLYELQKYAEFHFVSEENIMYSIGYPDYASHKQHHQKLIETFSQKSLQIELGEQTINDFISFLKDWFINHTLHEDLKISEYVKHSEI